jgi:glycosyltransferase involved in cell wall biosynthesis
MAPGKRGRVLWVTEEPPDPNLGGGNIRQAHLFEALARALPLELLVAGTVEDDRVRAAATRIQELPTAPPWRTEHSIGRRALDLGLVLGSRYPLVMYPAGSARRRLRQAVAESDGYDVVCVEHEALAPLVPQTPDVPWLVTFHNLLSGMLEEEIELAPGRRQRWMRRRDLSKARRIESTTLRRVERCVVCSEQDRDALNALVGDELGNRIRVVPNGVDLTRFRFAPLPPEPRLLLPGTLSWPPNVDGARWFCTEAWPRIRNEIPEATLTIAGRAPVAAVRELALIPGVSVVPDVPSMLPYFEAARVVIVPLRVGTGTRLKALEAMAAGRPLVGTLIGLDGIGVTDGIQAVVADNPVAQARAVVHLLRDDARAREIAQAGRRHVESRFGWDQIGRQFVDVVRGLLDQDGVRNRAISSSSVSQYP